MTIDRDILLESLGLKELDRAGWHRVGVPKPESVAGHSWGLCWLALLTCPPELDRERVLAMATLHDLPEVRAGDVTPHDGVDLADKRRAEEAAAADLFANRHDLGVLWREYADRSTPEAVFVHQLDKLEMGLQAQRYAAETGADTSEFVEAALAVLTDPRLRALLLG